MIEVDRRFLGLDERTAMKIDVFTLFPGWFDWFGEQRHVRNALGARPQLERGRHAARPRR